MNKEELITFIKDNLVLELEYKEGNYFDSKRITLKLIHVNTEGYANETLLESTAWLN